MPHRSRGKIRALSVDDEPLARDTVRLLLIEDPDIELVAECTNGRETVDAIRKHEPDLLFLDIQMPEMDGFEVLERIGVDKMPPVIFVTAYDEHALRAFEVQAVDYLLKPYTDERFRQAVWRAKTKIQDQMFRDLSRQLSDLLAFYRDLPKPGGAGETEHPDRIAVKSTGRIHFVKVDDIDWIEAADQYVKIHTAKETHLLRQSMSHLESKLDSRKFLRIHRSTIVNAERVEEMQHYHKGDYVVILADGTKLKLSRNRHEELQRILG